MKFKDTAENKQPKQKQYLPIDNREFVMAWMKCKSVDDVAAKLGISVQSASSKAYALRSKGVELPKMERVIDRNSVEELNKLIHKYKS